MMIPYRYAKPFLYSLPDAETAHNLAIAALRLPGLWKPAPAPEPSLAVEVAGLRFPGPVGLAAGFDKNAEALPALAKLGFGFLEAGTVTPLPQGGNPRPRLFRLRKDRAVINRMGFNNDGVAEAAGRIEAAKPRLAVPVGLNVGLNKDRAAELGDYGALIAKASAVADYVTVNISSPNTPGLRDLQGKDYFPRLCEIIRDSRKRHSEASAKYVPVFVKLAPDLTEEEAKHIADAMLRFRIDAAIISNTTVARPHHLRSAAKDEQGGLSGEPLKAKALKMLHLFREITGGELPFIGAGGISTAKDVRERLDAGASAVQLYSAMIYHGPYIAADIHEELGRTGGM